MNAVAIHFLQNYLDNIVLFAIVWEKRRNSIAFNMTDIRINQSLCRLCGCKNENGQSLCNDSNAELLYKVQETFSMLVSVCAIVVNGMNYLVFYS